MPRHTPAEKRKNRASKFIAGAIKRPGELKRKAKGAGMTVERFARRSVAEGSEATTLTKQQSRLFLQVLRRFGGKKET